MHPRPGIIRRSQALLEERKGRPVYIWELAAAAEVSERTLRTAFHEYFGVGPARCLHNGCARNKLPNWHRIIVRIQGATTGA
jgi:transcriptional regulator GlxA family with amidase domain